MSSQSVGFQRSKSYLTEVEEDKGIRVKLEKSLSTSPIMTVKTPPSTKLSDVAVRENKVFSREGVNNNKNIAKMQ